MKGYPDLPPIWWVGSIAVIYLGKWLLPWLHVGARVLTLASWILLGLALLLIGWSALQFFAKKTPIEPHHEPKALIVEGPYRISRNPIYLALVMLTLASALGHGSFIGLLSALGLWWVLDRRFAAPEEAMLLKTFGTEAEEFLRQTRRWL
ncbi:MAG: isoprenylcysteine carboxylmethyltransferase family protein [Sulfitobacter sp.]|nr:isoprenylcysteine carboxylmethyltransferase family protein [Sulfitobacter sp.]